MKPRIVVIGAGPGGYVAAIRATQLGADVCVIENDNIGGTCLNWGCIPSKVMKSTADLLQQIARCSEFGIRMTGDVALDPDRLAQRRKRVIDTQAKGIQALFQHRKIRYLNGFARISQDRRILVQMPAGGAETIPFDRLIVASGSRPLEIPGAAFDARRIISSNEAVHLRRIPKSIIIVGGGVIGCEFAFIFSAFGSQVTVVEAMDRLLPLPAVDEDCSRTLMREMKKRKIAVHLGAAAGGAEAAEETVRLRLSRFSPNDPAPPAGRLPEFLDAEQVLVCVGRRPNTEAMGLRQAGVALDPKGWVQANHRLETSAPDIYAIGDVLGPERVMLAHVASMEGIVAAENAMGAEREMDYRAVPGATFTMPEVANVGLTESQARERFGDVRADTVLYRTIGKAQVIGELGGMAKLVSDAQSGRVLGVHLVGAHATDLIGEGTLAVAQGVSVETLSRTIHAHPTLAEVMYEAALKATDRSLHG